MSQCILVVDDDSGNLGLLQEVLGQNWYKVVVAKDGQEGLERFTQYRPDLVLLDVRMPRLDGLKLCRILKSNPETRLTPVVLITGLSDTEDRIQGYEAGADEFLSRPFHNAELLARVKALLKLKAFTDELERAEAVVFALAQSIEGKDPYTKGHCDRLSEISVLLGRKLGLSQEQIDALEKAGTVHDVGKVAVPDAVLLKPGRLSPEESLLMREHPVVGERICKPLKSFRHVLPIIRHHHEKLDGTGYPDGLKGSQVPVTARVLQVVDVYDALTTQRPYKTALSAEDALGVMDDEVRKGWWDPEILSEFRKLNINSTRSGKPAETAKPQKPKGEIAS